MPITTTPWDPIKRLKTDDARAAYREAANETGDAELIAAVEADIALSLQRELEALPAPERPMRDDAEAEG